MYSRGGRRKFENHTSISGFKSTRQEAYRGCASLSPEEPLDSVAMLQVHAAIRCVFSRCLGARFPSIFLPHQIFRTSRRKVPFIGPSSVPQGCLDKARSRKTDHRKSSVSSTLEMLGGYCICINAWARILFRCGSKIDAVLGAGWGLVIVLSRSIIETERMFRCWGSW
jgi:hypothetical protein